MYPPSFPPALPPSSSMAMRGRMTVSGTREPWVSKEEMAGLCWASFRKRSPAVMMRRFCRGRKGKEEGVGGRKGRRGEVERDGGRRF